MSTYRVQLCDGTVDEVEADGCDESDEVTVLYSWHPHNVDPIAPNAERRVVKQYPNAEVVACQQVR